METIRAVAAYTIREHVRHKAWLSSALFGFALIAGGLVASILAQTERARLMLDLGLSANEAISLVTAVFLTVHLLLEEIESRAVFLVLTHPVRRRDYLLGRWLGTLVSIGAAMAAMGLAHLLVLQFFGGVPLGRFAAALGCSFAKVATMSALSLTLSLALTSEAAATSFSIFFWTLGHFTAELRFVAERAGGASKALLLTFAHVAPDFARFNFRDAWHAAAPAWPWLGWAGLYAAAYCAACLALASELFEQREF